MNKDVTVISVGIGCIVIAILIINALEYFSGTYAKKFRIIKRGKSSYYIQFKTIFGWLDFDPSHGELKSYMDTEEDARRWLKSIYDDMVPEKVIE